MTCAAKIATLAAEDFCVSGDVPLVVGVAAAGIEDASVLITVTSDTGSAYDGRVKRSVDYSTRIPQDMYMAPMLTLDPGVYTVRASIVSGNSSVVEYATVRSFDSVAVTFEVADQTEFNAAIATIKAASYMHARVMIAGGAYTYPSGPSYDMQDVDKLISFEGVDANVQFTGITPNLKWAYWYRCTFQSASGTAYKCVKGSHAVFERCKFMYSSTGLLASQDSYARVENCMAMGLYTGFVSVDVIRDLSWTYANGVMFSDCPVIESTVGHRDLIVSESDAAAVRKSTCWARYDLPLSGASIRNNVVYNDYSAFVRSTVSTTNLLMVGNAVTTSGTDPINLQQLTASVVVHNTINHTVSGVTLLTPGNVSGNYFCNNWFTTLGTDARRLADSGTWAFNASTSTFRIGTNCISAASPGFQNNYLFLGSGSSLRSAGSSVPAVAMSQGVNVRKQIGALPHHIDASLSSIYGNVLHERFFGFDMPAVVLS